MVTSAALLSAGTAEDRDGARVDVSRHRGKPAQTVAGRVDHRLHRGRESCAPLLASMYLFGRKMNARSLAAHQADSHVTALVQQNISALPLIQSYVHEAAETAAFALEVKKSFETRLRQHGLEVTYWLAIAILF